MSVSSRNQLRPALKPANGSRRRSSARSDQRTGSSAVEFALVFPLIMAFFFAMTVFTQAFLLRDTTQHAAYEGARKGMLLQADTADVKKTAEEFLRKVRVNGAEVKVEPENITTATREVTVYVQVPFNKNAWVGAPFLPKNWHISSVVKLRRFTTNDD